MAITILNIRYLNNFGQQLSFSVSGSIYNDDTDVLGYRWNFSLSSAPLSYGSRASSFRKGYAEKKVVVQIYAKSKAEYEAKLLFMQEVFERDIEAERPGRLYVNNDFTNAYMIEYLPTEWNNVVNYQTASLTFLIEEESWYTEKKTEFIPGESQQDLTGVMTFPHGFPATFTKSNTEQYIYNDHFQAAAAKFIVYGSATNPSISIRNHIYTVESVLLLNEYLVIDGLLKTVYKVTSSGERIELFYARGKEYYVFEPIPSGRHQVIATGDLRFDIIMYQKRSTPKWI